MDNIQQEIFQLICLKPKHYAKIIKKDVRLLAWVEANSLIKNDTLPAMIYSAIHQVNNLCVYQNKKKFERISTGFTNCGPAAVCKCTAADISSSVTVAKSQVSKQQQQLINLKRSISMKGKYGVEFNSQRPEIKHIWTKYKIPQAVSDLLEDHSWLNEQYIIKSRSLVDIADQLNVYYSTVGEYCKKHGFEIRRQSKYSLIEKEIINFINQQGFECLQGNWDIIGKEIDIFVPSVKLGIEVNGLYWHSFHPSVNKKENKFKHLNKTLLSKQAGINLIHISDYEWIHKRDIIKSMICARLGVNQKISARKCQIKTVEKSAARNFLNINHLQGSINFDVAIGLYYNNQLVSIMTFGKSRYSTIAEWELLRFCSLQNYTIVGGASKLLKLAAKEMSSIVSYCDLSKGHGNSYQQIGFKQHHVSGPGYFWTNGTKIFSRYKCQKKQLAKWLPLFDQNKSERDNMFANNYRRFWDCGNIVFIYTN